ncbi:MAG: peptide MFS transporter [Bacteroidota bacterium]|nr:peptide MFS transporter [Bacteroidota bacterium]
MNQLSTNNGHPKGLYVLFVTEMWERFSYYGMRAIFTLFMTKALLFDKSLGSQIYGSYTGLVYLTPLLGGYMADRYWGNRKSIIIGGIMMAMGQFLMFFSGSMYQDPGTASLIMYSGLGFLIFGNGFFKPNISTMVGQLYPKGDKRIDSAFTIFYMGINLGAFIAPLLCGALGEVYDSTGSIVPSEFKWGFFAAGCGMVLSIILFVWLKNHYIVTPEGKQIGVSPNVSRDAADIDTPAELKSEFTMGQIGMWTVIFAAITAASYFTHFFDMFGSIILGLTIAAPGLIISDKSLTKLERDRIWVIYIVAFFVIFFWAAFEQAGASLTYFASDQTERDVNWHFPREVIYGVLGLIVVIMSWLLSKTVKMKNEKAGVKELFMLLMLASIGGCIYGFIKIPETGLEIKTITASSFQSINAVAIVIFAPFFAMLWTWMGKKNIEPASPYKQSIGLFLLALGYLVIAQAPFAPGVKVTMLWLVMLYVIHTFGELCLSPIGLSMVNKLAPIKFASLLMGVWFLSTSFANKFAGTLSALYPEEVKIEKSINTEVNKSVLDSLSNYKIDTNVWKKDLKLNLSTSLPMVAVTKIENKQSEIDSVTAIASNGKSVEVSDYFLSIIKSTNGNIDRATVSADGRYLYTHDSVETKKDGGFVKVAKLQVWDLKPVKPSFMGVQINNLKDFFMIFVFMAGAASIILFFLSRRMLKMMHGVR